MSIPGTRRITVAVLALVVAIGGVTAAVVMRNRAKQSLASKDFGAWYEALQAIRGKADKGMSQYGDMADGVARATMVQYAAEREFTNMKTAQDDAVKALGALALPPDLTPTQEQALRDSLAGVAAGLAERGAVMEAFLPYANNRQAVDVPAAEERMKKAQAGLEQAFAGIDGLRDQVAKGLR
jgi:hypothetical protein